MNKPCYAVWQVAGMEITRVFSLFVQWLTASAPAVIILDGAKRYAVFYIAISAIRFVVFLLLSVLYCSSYGCMDVCWTVYGKAGHGAQMRPMTTVVAWSMYVLAKRSLPWVMTENGCTGRDLIWDVDWTVSRELCYVEARITPGKGHTVWASNCLFYSIETFCTIHFIVQCYIGASVLD